MDEIQSDMIAVEQARLEGQIEAHTSAIEELTRVMRLGIKDLTNAVCEALMEAMKFHRDCIVTLNYRRSFLKQEQERDRDREIEKHFGVVNNKLAYFGTKPEFLKSSSSNGDGLDNLN